MCNGAPAGDEKVTDVFKFIRRMSLSMEAARGLIGPSFSYRTAKMKYITSSLLFEVRFTALNAHNGSAHRNKNEHTTTVNTILL